MYKKILSLVLASSLIFSACTFKTGGASSAKTITDMTGKVVALPQKPERVVVLSAAECEIVYALGAGDSVVARGEYCNYPPETEGITAIQSGSATNIEEIIALKPSVVLLSTMDQSTEQTDALNSAGIPTVALEASDIASVYTAISLIGEVLGKQDNAKKLIAQMQSRFDAVAKKVPTAATKPSVYFEVSPLEFGLWTAGSGTFMDEIATTLGLANTFSDVSAWAEVSQEQIIERNPDIIVTVTMYVSSGAAPSDEIKQRTGWQNITAVKNNKVIFIDGDAITRPGPRLADAAETLYKLIYES